MAYAFVGVVLNNRRTKIFDFSFLDNDAAANQAIGLVASGLTVMDGAPDDVRLEVISGPDVGTSHFAITAVATTGITVRKLTAGGNANPVVVRATLRCGHSATN